MYRQLIKASRRVIQARRISEGTFGALSPRLKRQAIENIISARALSTLDITMGDARSLANSGAPVAILQIRPHQNEAPLIQSTARILAIDLMLSLRKEWLEKMSNNTMPWAPLARSTAQNRRKLGLSLTPLVKTGSLLEYMSSWSVGVSKAYIINGEAHIAVALIPDPIRAPSVIRKGNRSLVSEPTLWRGVVRDMFTGASRPGQADIPTRSLPLVRKSVEASSIFLHGLAPGSQLFVNFIGQRKSEYVTVMRK